MADFYIRGNWVDLIILATLIYFTLIAVGRHFWLALTDFASFLFSMIAALKFYPFASEILGKNFSLSNSFANALGYLICAVLAEITLSYFLLMIIKKFPTSLWKFPGRKVLSVIPAAGEGIIFVAFILTLSLAMPIAPSIKRDITEAKLGGRIVQETSGFEQYLSDIFGGVVEETLTYLTVKPGSRDTIPLNVEEQGLSVDEVSERRMFELVNEERVKRGLGQLVWTQTLAEVGRKHARDMWERKYFSHYSLEGEDLSNRLDKSNISYSLAGENLALAPTVVMAHNGLMNSEGHRANILEADFGKIGIGAVDNGIYGKMFVQVFTD